MSTTEIRIPPPSTWLEHRTRLGIPRSIIFLGLILALAAGLLFYNLQAAGQGNLYYTAAVKSMLVSWKNFFFVAAEPGGSVSVDKPPLGFWLQTLSALIFGVNGFAVMLPQILAGLLSVGLLYHLISRKYGSAAGLAAAFILAVTPASVAVDRNNTIDALLVLSLLLAAWAFIKAVETNRLRFLLLGAALVGLGFNIKMLEAFLALPALLAFYFLCSSQGWGIKLVNLFLAMLVLCVVSFSWITVVDLTPPSQRPYVGSSTHNSEWELAFGYNGLTRLIGRFGGRGGGFNPPNNFAGRPSNGQPNSPSIQNFFNGSSNLFGGGGFGGNQDAGQPGLLRFFQAPLSKQVSWLLPFTLIGLLVLTARAILKFKLPLPEEAWPLVLWGGWLLTGLVFFSIAGFMHAYYVTTIAPPIAALAAISLAKLHQLGKDHPIPAGFWLLIAASATLVFQTYSLIQYRENITWMLIPACLLAIGIVLWVISIFRTRIPSNRAALLLAGTAMLLAPLVWSGFTTLYTGASAMPVAFSGGPARAGNTRFTAIRPGSAAQQPALLNYLEQNTKNTEYLLAVPSASMGDSYVLASGRPVLFMGGFIGSDPVVNAIQLAALVQAGKLRYVLDSGTLARSKPDIANWLQTSCKVATGALSNSPNSSQNPGGGARPFSRSGGFFGRGGQTLYQCGG